MAYQQIAFLRRGRVLGTSSRGVFLGLPDKWVIYLSPESRKGPLTLNLIGNFHTLSNLQTGQQVEINKASLYFPRSMVLVDWQGAEIWQTPDASLKPAAQKERLRRQTDLVDLLAVQPLTTGAQDALNMLREMSGDVSATRYSGEIPFPKDIFQGSTRLSGTNWLEKLIDELIPLLGRGSGLTPSGDDLVLGAVLALNRWLPDLWPGLEISLFNQCLLDAAETKTTDLSFSLLRCAALGQADEGLILALDSLVGELPDPDQVAAGLTSWGNTSGIYALTGMVLALRFIESGKNKVDQRM